MRTFAIVNQKGGCGKTTTAINLAASFARLGRRTLLVDLDPQAHCAVGLGVPEENLDLHIGEALLWTDERPLDEARLLWRVGRNLELAPSTVRLAGLEAASGGLAGREDRDRRLACLLRRLQPRFDACLIDCPPTIGLLTYNALRAADEAIIPVETGFFAMRGAERQVRTIRSLARRLGGHTPHRLLATMHKPGESLAEELLTSLRDAFDEAVMPIVIRYDAKLREAASLGRPLVEYEPTAVGAQDYADLAAWLLTNPASSSSGSSDFGEGSWAASLWSSSAGEARSQTPSPTPSGSRPIDPRDLARTARLLARSHAESPAERAPAESARSVADASAPAASGATAAESSTVSRAADLAARARLLLARSAQLQARLQGSEGGANTAIGARSADNASPEASPAPSTGAQGLFGVRETGAGVLFVHPAPAAAKVFVAGDFNDWSPDATPLRFNAALGVHEACVALPSGRREYRLVVDGRWIADPHNPAASGERNSVVIVTRAEHTSCAEAAD